MTTTNKKSSGVDKFLNSAGGVLLGAFGKEASIGFLVGMLKHVTPYECYDLIIRRQQLFPTDITDENMARIRAAIKRIGLTREDLSDENLIKIFQNDRPDLLGVVINTPDGLAWFKQQIDTFRVRLNLQ